MFKVLNGQKTIQKKMRMYVTTDQHVMDVLKMTITQMDAQIDVNLRGYCNLLDIDSVPLIS